MDLLTIGLIALAAIIIYVVATHKPKQAATVAEAPYKVETPEPAPVVVPTLEEVAKAAEPVVEEPAPAKKPAAKKPAVKAKAVVQTKKAEAKKTAAKKPAAIKAKPKAKKTA